MKESNAPDDSLDKEVFFHALDLSTPAERAAFLNQVCAGDPARRARLETLLAGHFEEDSFMQGPAGDAPGFAAVGLHETPGMVIGRYKLLQKIGEGGMGVVYMAEQQEPVRRKVALKVIKVGMDTRQVVARFEAERQALALMDHPNIARVLDGGATETGRPYFVMELVQGVPITEFCAENRLTVEGRVKLFIPVCQALQSAHQKGIIHRDLKPTNILVTINAGVPHPMVIDFGVAKALNQQLTEKTVFTQFATMIGTPAYMSPEQAEMSRLDVDTRSDIYSLGVLLYELLTGSTPFPEKRLRDASYQEMQRIIVEEEPERPSTRLRRKLSTPSPVANNAPLSTDLDWIAMKCLEKDRARRYGTANGLAADLYRYLNDEPVSASPPSALYSLQKHVRRNKVAFAAGAIVALALVAGVGLASWQALRAARERDAKESALREQTRLRQEAQKAQYEESLLREEAQAQAYASDLLLAQQAIATDNFSFARELLNRHRPGRNSGKEMRGWEWRYLWSQCTSDALAKVWQAPDPVNDLAASRDGKWLAVGLRSEDTAVSLLRFVDRTTAVLVTNIPARRATDVTLAFSPTAPLLAFNSTHYEGPGIQPTVHLWNVETRQEIFQMQIRSFCGGLYFSPDGSRLLIALMNFPGATNGELLLLRVPDGTLVWERSMPIPIPFPYSAVDAAFHSAAVLADNLHVIDPATGQVRWRGPSQPASWEATFTKDGARLLTAAGSPSILSVWDAASGKLTAQPVPLHRDIEGLGFLSDGKTLISYSADGGIQFWDATDPTQPRLLGRPLRSEGGDIHCFELGSDGKTVYTGNSYGSVYAWDIRPRNSESRPLILPEVFDWQFAPDSGSILTIDSHGQVARRSGPDFQENIPLFSIRTELARDLDQADFTDDGEMLAVSHQGSIRVWDLTNRSSSPRLVLPGYLGSHSFAPHTKMMVAYQTISGPLEEWDLKTGQRLNWWPAPVPWKGYPPIALSREGKNVLIVGHNGTEGSVIEAATGRVSGWKNPEPGGIWGVDFSPDGSLFAVASRGGYAQIWETASRRLLRSFGHRQYGVWSAVFSLDGARLATAGTNQDPVTLWDLEGRELLRLQAAGMAPDTIRFSPDGNMLGCGDKMGNRLYVWRAPTWEEIAAVEKTNLSLP